MNAFDTYRYIQKRMCECDIPKDAMSCDEEKRILNMAKIALKPDWITKERTHELMFTKVGNVWVSHLEYIW